MDGSIKAGAGKVDITPPLGISIVGTFIDNRAEMIIDKLFVNSLIIDDGKKEIAIISVDVCVIPDNIYKDIVSMIVKNCGIKKDNIIIGATHTHSGPLLAELFLGIGEIWIDYIESFIRSVVRSVSMAQKNMKQVRIGVGKGKNDNFFRNSDLT